MKKFVFIVMMFLSAQINVSRADEWWPVTTVTCMPEVNFFMIYTASLHSDVSSGDSKIFQDNNKEIEKKHNILTSYNHDINTCKLKDATIKFQIDYYPLREKGECGGDHHAKVKLWRNNELLIDLSSFDYDCRPEQYINNIIYKHFPGETPANGQLFLGGLDYSTNLPKAVNITLWMNESKFPLTDQKMYELRKAQQE